MKINIIIVVFCIFFSSCLTKKQWEQKYPCIADTITKTKIITKDSIVEKKIEIKVPIDSAAIRATVDCDSKGKAQLKDTTIKGKNNSSIEVSIKNGILKANCKCDTFNIIKSFLDTFKVKQVITSKDIVKIQRIDTSALVNWHWLIWVGLGTFILGFIFKWKVL